MTLHGSQELKMKLRRLGDDAWVKQALEDSLVAGALLVVNEAKKKAPYRTGNLRRSLHVGGYGHKTRDFSAAKECSDIGKPPRFGLRVRVRCGTNLIYARIQEYGGTIVAKNKPFLVFKTRDGRWHSVKSVTIPARAYLRPAFDEKRRQAVNEVRDIMHDKVLRRVKVR